MRSSTSTTKEIVYYRTLEGEDIWQQRIAAAREDCYALKLRNREKHDAAGVPDFKMRYLSLKKFYKKLWLHYLNCLCHYALPLANVKQSSSIHVYIAPTGWTSRLARFCLPIIFMSYGCTLPLSRTLVVVYSAIGTSLSQYTENTEIWISGYGTSAKFSRHTISSFVFLKQFSWNPVS